MICRLWRGSTTTANAYAYERFLRDDVLPAIASRRIAGLERTDFLRREVDDGVEFVTLMWFESIDAIKAFAGTEDYAVARVADADRALLRDFDSRAVHFEVVSAALPVSARKPA